MNSHFQSIATTSTSRGSSPAGTGFDALILASGRNGSRVWAPIQVREPIAMTISSGAVQISTSSWIEWFQSAS